MLNKRQKLIKELETELDNFRKMYAELGTELSKIEKDIAILELIESGDLEDVYFDSDSDKVKETPYFPNPSNPPYYNQVVSLYGCPAVGRTGLPIDYYTNITSITSAVKEDSNEEESK